MAESTIYNYNPLKDQHEFLPVNYQQFGANLLSLIKGDDQEIKEEEENDYEIEENHSPTHRPTLSSIRY